MNFTVNTTADHAADGCDDECTVRDALAAADALASADSITIPAGIYNLASALHVTGPIAISGDGSTLDTAYHDRVLEVTGGFVQISSVRIARGQSPDITGGSGILMRGGTLTLDRVTLDGHSNSLQGGALLQQGGTLNMNDSEVTGNHGSSGGGLYIAAGEANVDRTLWLSNDGGAIDNAGGTRGSTASD